MRTLRPWIAAALLAFIGEAGAVTLYATSIRTRLGPEAPIECNLYTVDPATARAAFLAPLKADGGASIAIVSLATQPGTGVIFGVTGLPAGPATLVTVDPQTGRVGLIGRIGHDVSDIAFDRQGRLFAWLPDGNRLARIDPATGAATLLAASGIQGVMGGGMVIDDDDKVYVAATSATGSLDRVDLETGLGSPGPRLSGAPFGSAITNLTFSPDRRLYAVNSNMGSPASTTLVAIDPHSGKVSPVGVLPTDSHALIFSQERAGESHATLFAGLGGGAVALLLLIVVLARRFRRR